MRVKSNVDLGFNILIWITIGIITVSMLIIPQNEQVIGFAVGIPMLFLLFWIYFGTYYEFREDYLLCKSGPFFEKIAYEKIKSVKLSQNMLSSMALSTKRIEIRQHDKGYIMGTTFISPINREEFLNELVSRCKNLF
jgi:uncharacterized membrane protein YobD (UPF0266 family)